MLSECFLFYSNNSVRSLCIVVSLQFDLETDDEKDPNRLKKLFQVAQSILVFKHVQAEVAEEQLKETAMGEGRLTAKKGRVIRPNGTCNTVGNAALF